MTSSDRMPDSYLMLYGLQRTGTNYLRELMEENFNAIRFMNHGDARALPLHKHFRPYEEKVFIPDHRYLNNFRFESFAGFDSCVSGMLTGEMVETGTLKYLVTVRNPLSWHPSICRFARKNRWPGYRRRSLNHQYMIDYSLFYGKWLDFSNQSDRVVIVKYEDLLRQLEKTLCMIGAAFHLERKQDTFRDIDRVKMSRRFTDKKRKVYLEDQPADRFSGGELFILSRNLDPRIAERLGYQLVND